LCAFMVGLPFPRVRDGTARRFAFAPVLVALAVLVVHGRSILFGFTGLDDRDLIVDDQAFLAQSASLWRVFGRAYMHVVDTSHAYYRPLVTASYVIDAHFSGLDPRGYHLTNVALYAVAGVLVHALLRTLALGPAIALAGALVFAVLPALAPAVAWIPGRNDSLLAVFALASWIAFVRDAARPSIWHKTAHCLFFGLALFTKESAVVLPAVCLAHVALARPEDWARVRRPRVIGGFAAAWAVIAAARVFAHSPSGSLAPSLQEVLANLPLVVTGLGKIVLPVHLSVFALAPDVPLWPGVIACVAMAVAAWSIPAARPRIVALGAVAFVLFLAPIVIFSGSLVLDQRLVLPACGVLIAAGEIVDGMRLERVTLIASAAAVFLAFAGLTVAFEGAFRDPGAFARDAVDGSPHSPLAHFCLGREYQTAGEDDRALVEYRAALALGPSEVVHNNIAVIAMARGLWEEAERELAQEIALNPGYGKAYYNLGIALRHEGRMDEACAAEGRALELAADDDAVGRERARDCSR
jgi:protein O-mannosyl-transferase